MNGGGRPPPFSAHVVVRALALLTKALRYARRRHRRHGTHASQPCTHAPSRRMERKPRGRKKKKDAKSRGSSRGTGTGFQDGPRAAAAPAGEEGSSKCGPAPRASSSFSSSSSESWLPMQAQSPPSRPPSPLHRCPIASPRASSRARPFKSRGARMQRRADLEHTLLLVTSPG